MSLYFLDSSALVKRYVGEIGSTWLRTITALQSNNQLIITRITWVEVVSALARRQREGTLSTNDVDKTVQIFQHDLDTQYGVVELDQSLAEAAGQLVRQHNLRAYDAVQLAAALRIQTALVQKKSSTLNFLTADNRLIIAAKTEGLMTDNPNSYP